jgi:hypothetical protein
VTLILVAALECITPQIRSRVERQSADEKSGDLLYLLVPCVWPL